MTEFEEFVILLHRHPELIAQLWELAQAGATQPTGGEKTDREERA